MQQHEEEQRLKQLEEQKLLKQNAEPVVQQYAEQIKALHVSFAGLMTEELIEKRKIELLQQLNGITFNKQDLTLALKTLNIVQAPKIEEALLAKTQEIDLAAQQQQSKALLEEQRVPKLREDEQQVQLLEEEQILKQFAETHERQQFITSSLSLIDGVLSELAEQISRVEQHHSSDAVNQATHLLEELRGARNDYYIALNRPNITISQASTAFKQTCRDLINDAKEQLENDLGWGDYLANLFRKIANAVIWLGSFGHRSSFFPLVQPTSIIELEQAEQRLELS